MSKLENTMSKFLNNAEEKQEEHKPNFMAPHKSSKKMNAEHVTNNTSLYCFFTRNKRDDIVKNDGMVHNNKKIIHT